jgi:rhodanese-related sulfurtransferase
VISPGQLAALLRSEAPHAVLDLRERGAYERGHIFRATSLPRRLLELRLPRLVTARRTPLVVYDDEGTLADLARPTLDAMGYADVRVLTGGLAAWRASGRAVVQGVNVPSKAFGERMLRERGTPQVGPRELQRWMEAREDMVIVDARTREEYVRGCIPGAWHVPGGELVLRITDLAPRPRTTIVVHCGGRTRSYIGAESLRRMGLPNRVVALENGTMGWDLAGLALERGASRWAPPPSDEARAAARAVAAGVAAAEGVPLVCPHEVQALWQRRDEMNVHLMDVRTSEEYGAGHVPGAVWAPGGQAVQATDEYVAVRAAALVLLCDDGCRATMTAAWLRRMGFPRVMVLRGGTQAWGLAGGRLEEGTPPLTAFGYEQARARTPRITPAALHAALDREAPLLIDVDQSDAYVRGHVPGAAWLCRSRLELTMPAVAGDKRRAIVVTCGDGIASSLAAATLGALGYTSVGVLDGGTRAWEAAELPLERGPARLLDRADDVVPKPYERGRAAMEAYLRWEEELDEEGRSPHALLPPPSGS